jgi:precorrin-8X/cobalt-precorrin-8 methylmutase
MPEFDAYLMVDWSASSRPVIGENSIWYCLVARKGNNLSVAALENPATRRRAVAEINDILRGLALREQTVLVGFDFPYGYPAGTAAALGLKDTPAWLGVWREIAGRIIDRDDNSNNRFEVAADLNHRISGGCYPFWGCPEGRESATMSCTKGRPGLLAEKRLTDIGNMQPIWKLYGNGCVGSQALLGIPHLTALHNDAVLSPISRVWPFETGLGTLAGRPQRDYLIVHAEIYPSLLRIQPAAGEVKDAVQVRTMATHFAALDDAGKLAMLFAGPEHLSPEERETIEREEGWTLGVLSGQPVQPRLALRPLPIPLSTTTPVTGPPRHRGGSGRTTAPGYQNRNGQTVLRSTGLAGTDHGQSVYVLQCGGCRHEYGANGSDIFQRRCPACQGGRPGLVY